MKCCPKANARKITREEHEDARQVARDIAKSGGERRQCGQSELSLHARQCPVR